MNDKVPQEKIAKLLFLSKESFKNKYCHLSSVAGVEFCLLGRENTMIPSRYPYKLQGVLGPSICTRLQEFLRKSQGT